MEFKVEITPLYEGKFVVRTTTHYENFKIYNSLDEVLCALSRIDWWPKDPMEDADVRELEESQK